MFRPRIIPVLLLQNNGAVKTRQFENPIYLGDVVNIARIFSELEADELIILDIDANAKNTFVSPDIIREISSETSMPLTAGGGISSLGQIEVLVRTGAEKVVIGTSAYTNPQFVKEAVRTFGSSTIAVCLDFRADNKLYYANGKIKSVQPLEDKIKELHDFEVGEIIIQSIDRDGMRQGYDLDLIKKISQLSQVPVVALGGCGNTEDIIEAHFQAGATACAASSLFTLFKSGVLISYLEKSQKQQLFSKL